MWVLFVFYLMNGVVVETYHYNGPGTPFKSQAACYEVLQAAAADIARDNGFTYGKDFTMECKNRGQVA